MSVVINHPTNTHALCVRVNLSEETRGGEARDLLLM